MARGKSVDVEGDKRTKLHREAGDAAAILTRQMLRFQRSSENCLNIWAECANRRDFQNAHFYFDKAVRLSDAMMRLGAVIARMRGETHQHIKVQRLAPSSIDAPEPEAQDNDNLLPEHDNSALAVAPGREGGTSQIA